MQCLNTLPWYCVLCACVPWLCKPPKSQQNKVLLLPFLLFVLSFLFVFLLVKILLAFVLVAFASAECINPQRIPAMLITRKDEKTGNYTPVPTREPKQTDEVCGKSKLYQYVGLQTDYTPSGKGLISPKMITAVLEEARA